MIINVNPTVSLDEKISGFSPHLILADEYQALLKYAGELFPYIVTEKWVLRLFIENGKDKSIKYYLLPISTYCSVKTKLLDISTSQTVYVIEAFNGHTVAESTMKSDFLTSLGCKELLSKGCLFSELNTKYLLDYLLKICFDAPIAFSYSQLGWIRNKDTLVFCSGNLITKDSKSSYEYRYLGQMELKSHGSESIYFDMITSEVLPNDTLLFVWLLGFASPILSLLNQSLDLGCLLFNLSNTSSRGKTTAGMLAASVFANPMFNKGTVISCNSTNNALLGFVASNNSHTVILDEIATSDIAGFRKLLYCFCSGRDRMRLNTDGDLRDCKSFDSVIITTAEFPIVDENAPNGIRTRVFEITDDLTISAENSERIKEVVITNYALLGEKFIRFLLTKDIESISADYQTSYTALKEATTKIKVGDLTMRILSKLAVILVTAEYVKECFKFDFDTNLIKQFILKCENGIRSETDIADKALDCILQSISRNGNHYISGNSDYVQAAFGKVYENDGVKTIYMLKDEVEHILASNHFDNPKIIFQKWKMSGIIDCEKDRYYKRVRLTNNVPKQNCFVFNIKDERSMFEDSFGHKASQLSAEGSASYISESSDAIDIEF